MSGHVFRANPGLYDSMERVCEACGYVESAAPARCAGPRESVADDPGQRLYVLLAFYDVRDGSFMGDLVRAAREGWERSRPEMAESDAWAEFDALWGRRDPGWRP